MWNAAVISKETSTTWRGRISVITGRISVITGPTSLITEGLLVVSVFWRVQCVFRQQTNVSLSAFRPLADVMQQMSSNALDLSWESHPPA